MTEHFFDVPKDYSNPDNGTIQVFARSVRKHDIPIVADESKEKGQEKEQLPWMCYLQGGPGHKCAPGQQYPWTQSFLDRGYQMLYLDHGLRQREIQDSTNLFRVSLDSSLGDNETQEFSRGYPKGAHRRIQLHAVLSEHGEGLSEVVDMVSHARAFDHHVINVGLHVLADLVGEDLIDHPLVDGSGILQPEGHYFVIVSPPVSDEGYLLFVF